MTRTPLAIELAGWVAGLREDDIPQAVMEDARLRVLDTLGLMLAASATPIGLAVRAAGAALGAGDAAGIVGTGARNTASLAALVNGTLAHAMDFDDTHNASVMHPSAVTVPTALAAAQARGLGGRALLMGVALGNEIACRLGMIAPGAFHDVGLHPTSVLGAPAAALVAGRLSLLSAEQLGWAIGISASQGSGVLEAYSDGSWSKTLHPGWAAHAGIVASTLAGAGFTGPGSGLDGRYGLFPTHVQAAGYRFDDGVALDGLGTRWHMLDSSFKLYPCAHAIHALVEAAAALRTRHALNPAAIARVELDIPQGFEGQIAEPRAAKLAPRTTTHARASVLYAVAAVLIDGELGMQHYTDAAILRPDLLELCGRITHRSVASPSPIRFSGAVTIHCTDGRIFNAGVDDADGTGSRRLAPARLEAKFRQTAGRVLAPSAVQALLDLTSTLETLPRIDSLMNATAAEAAS